MFDAWTAAGKDVSAYDSSKLMSVDYDGTELATEADERIRTFQADAAREAGIFHHLITLPTYHTAALSTDNLAKEYFGDQGMLGYVKATNFASRQGQGRSGYRKLGSLVLMGSSERFVAWASPALRRAGVRRLPS